MQMSQVRLLTRQALAGALIVACTNTSTTATQPHDRSANKIVRTVVFELTFAQNDLVWLGDAASPTASVYIKPTARPIATDLHVDTVIERHTAPARRYMREARIVADNHKRLVHAFTKEREKVIGAIDSQGRFTPNNFYQHNHDLLPSWPADAEVLVYDAQENALYYEEDLPGPQLSESLDFLPLQLMHADGTVVAGQYSIEYVPPHENGSAETSLVLQAWHNQGKAVTLAIAAVPSVFRRADVELGSFDNVTGTYLPEAAYRPGATDAQDASATFTILGQFTSSVQSQGESLVALDVPQLSEQADTPATKIIIDGDFDDWRNVAGVDDPRGDLVPYLEYVPDVDLLEFKVSHDDQHLYLYARVAGQVGRSHPDGGRSYFYAYLDVDQNAGTGFLPTRDDDCYFGVDIGDDCEVQFEFVNNTFRKTFYGFCGLGGDDRVLKQEVTLGQSQYGRFDENGNERANYKSEYIYRDGVTQITEDLKLGTSDTIQIAVSPDGREVEIVSQLAGFLQDKYGRPTVAVGQTIDLAAGMECDSKAYLGKKHWAADSTPAIRGYQLSPSVQQDD